MTLDRREMLRGLGAFAGSTALGTISGHAQPAAGFRRKADFLIDHGYTYLNAAYTHPIPKVAMEAVRRAAEGRCSMSSPTGCISRARCCICWSSGSADSTCAW